VIDLTIILGQMLRYFKNQVTGNELTVHWRQLGSEAEIVHYQHYVLK